MAKATVLIIEDDKTIRTGLTRLMEAEGYTPLFAENGVEGVKLALEHKPDLIICDIAMPEMNGYEVLAKIKQSPSLAAKPFFFLSAKITKEDEAKGLAAGATGYLKKPMWPEDILKVVKQHLR
ncbi:MAG: response regulator [Bacteroidota bacterium]|nr:response regulator [Candidatus Kapabacteria bacterium]MDW8219030.1 response regulator [Bacteroidota bacterium]